MKIPAVIHSFRKWLPLSPEGLGWLVLTSATLITGLAKSINLITLLGCVLFAIGPINIWLAWRQVRGLRSFRTLPDFLIAGAATSWLVHIVQDSPRRRQGISLIDPGPDAEAAWFVDLQPERVQSFERTIAAPCRGILPLQPVRIASGHPFGLAEVVRIGDDSATTIAVAPRCGVLNRNLLRRWLSRSHFATGAVRSRPFRHPTGQAEFHGLRPFRAGDSPRLIHWRTSARHGELMVREFEEYPNDDLVLIVDLGHGDPQGGETFERMLSLAATIVAEWCRQKGDALTVVFADRAPRCVTGVTGTTLLADIMRGLAAAQPAQRVASADVLAVLHESTRPATVHLLLSVGPSTLAAALHEELRDVLVTIDLTEGTDAEFFELGVAPAISPLP